MFGCVDSYVGYFPVVVCYCWCKRDVESDSHFWDDVVDVVAEYSS